MMSLFHGIKENPILSAKGLCLIPQFPAGSDSNTPAPTKQAVVFDIHVLPTDKLATTACVSCACAADTGGVANVWIALEENLIARANVQPDNVDVKTICDIAPEPFHSSFVG